MTNSAYGTKRIEFKGKRIAQIRKYELNKTVEIYKTFTQNELRIIWLGYIDGFLTLNNESVSKVATLIKKEKPDIIFF
jgi:LmbE family N-acetylglucosaminyl deacetylase